MPKKARGRAPRCGALPSSGCSAPPVPVPGWAMRRWPAPSAHCRQRGCLQPSAKSHSKSAPANQEHPHFTAFFPKKPTRPLLASIPPVPPHCSSRAQLTVPAGRTSYFITAAISWRREPGCSVSFPGSVRDAARAAPEPLLTDSGLLLALFPYCQESEARRENYSLS